MRQAGIEGCHRRRSIRTTERAAEAEAVPDLFRRNFKAKAPNRLWVSDLTYVPTMAGFLFLAVVLDAFSRRVIGWAMGPRPTMQPAREGHGHELAELLEDEMPQRGGLSEAQQARSRLRPPRRAWR
jgi:transposase InsO family protein